ncbi:MAG TPA: alpha/beta hydrolase [Microlunatus sp.]|nr:alpha/beta hydrolase [Microlunatus sp.]
MPAAGAGGRWLAPPAPPHPWLLAPYEVPRAVTTTGLSLTLSPLLLARHRVGRDHPRRAVFVVPGLGGGNAWTLPLRTYVAALGHDVRVPAAGTMKALSGEVVRSLSEQVSVVAEETASPVVVLAWSVGGCFARRLAARRPDLVSRLITLGTPLDGGLWYGSEAAAGRGLPVPVTALYSRTDGIFAWRRCVQRAGAGAENVEICSSHFGLSTHPWALHVIGSRLTV